MTVARGMILRGVGIATPEASGFGFAMLTLPDFTWDDGFYTELDGELWLAGFHPDVESAVRGLIPLALYMSSAESTEKRWTAWECASVGVVRVPAAPGEARFRVRLNCSDAEPWNGACLYGRPVITPKRFAG